ncbi:MAG: response regulator [Nitrososphaeraceae archaeon]
MQEAKKKILIVDDDPGTTTTFKLGLESNGFQVDAFTDPKETLKNFKSNHYDLSLIDIRMPSMNGFELFQELNKLDNSLRVCFITSFKTYYQSLVEEYPGMDQKCYIQKPISIKDLVNHIKSIKF